MAAFACSSWDTDVSMNDFQASVKVSPIFCEERAILSGLAANLPLSLPRL